MTDTITKNVHVVGLSADGVKVALTATATAFWLPSTTHVEWRSTPRMGERTTVTIPLWLASRHRQLVGDVEYERAKATKENAVMGDRPKDAGNGAIFRNDHRQKNSYPHYRGEVTIRGEKFKVSGWIKQGARGPYLSLALRSTDGEYDNTALKLQATAQADNWR
jgi:hypothetical protein